MACAVPAWTFTNPAMLSLSHRQLQQVMDAARVLPVEKRSQFLQRLSAMLELRGRFSDADVADAAKLALTGLVHRAA
jgi:hypothetical protein